MGDKMHKVIQLTDTHLFSSKNEEFFGINPYSNLEKIIAKIREETPDLIIATGDISHDGSKQSYQNFSDLIRQLKTKTYWCPGNHDNCGNMKEIFMNNEYLGHGDFGLDNWRFIYIESNIKGKAHGHILSGELNLLGGKINKDKKNTVLLMHHHPLHVKTPLVDKFIIDNGADFLRSIKCYNQIKLIICGHVHGDYSIKTNYGLPIECGPATSIQWKKKTTVMDTINLPGYKIYYFNDDGYASQGEFIK